MPLSATRNGEAALAVMKAEAPSHKPRIVGAVAFSRSGDPATGDFGAAKVIRKLGDVSDDLIALWSSTAPRDHAVRWQERRSLHPQATFVCGLWRSRRLPPIGNARRNLQPSVLP